MIFEKFGFPPMTTLGYFTTDARHIRRYLDAIIPQRMLQTVRSPRHDFYTGYYYRLLNGWECYIFVINPNMPIKTFEMMLHGRSFDDYMFEPDVIPLLDQDAQFEIMRCLIPADIEYDDRER